MLLRDSKRTSILAYPMIATAAITLFLLRNRQITYGNSPGSGITIAGGELLVRIAAIPHAAASIGASGFSLLLRIATAPAIFAFTTLETEFRTALTAFDGVVSILQQASLYFLRAL
jgi:hypothetical protein